VEANLKRDYEQSNHDDGIGFDPEHHPTRRNGKGGLGLLSMRERAIYSGGALKVKSVRRAGLAKAGTAIEVRIPLGKRPATRFRNGRSNSAAAKKVRPGG
jgi:signal transduction histidine kinase